MVKLNEESFNIELDKREECKLCNSMMTREDMANEEICLLCYQINIVACKKICKW